MTGTPLLKARTPAGSPLTDDLHVARELAHSGRCAGLDAREWLRSRDSATAMTVTRTDIAEIPGWHIDSADGTLRHDSRRFFSVRGLDVAVPGAVIPGWQQPIICQPEVGILGILVARIDGVAHLLMQAKNEPGNPTGTQLSPTVQATRSNYTRVHGGRAVPYLEVFRSRREEQVVVDVRQSEQGSWFLRKRNRNMVVEVPADVDVLDGFRWFTLADVHRALTADNLVNMDTRTVLSCLPLHGSGIGAELSIDTDDFNGSLARSMLGVVGSVHRTRDVLAALTETRADADPAVTFVPLDGLRGWRWREGAIVHDTGAFFDVIGVRVESRGREVARWSQPMFAARGTGLACLLVADVEGVLHALVQLRVEPGFADVAELGPTVQCTPGNYDHLPVAARPPFLDDVLGADPATIRFDSTMAEEGGRFLDTCTRYLIVETPVFEEPPGFRWMTVHQLVGLLRHSHYVNVQARSLLLCLQSLAFTTHDRSKV